MVTLFLFFSKRRAELLMLEANDTSNNNLKRRVLDDYSPEILKLFLAITTACTIISYALYTLSSETAMLYGSVNMIYTLPFVVYSIFRYIFLLHHHAKENDTAKDQLQPPHFLVAHVLLVGTTLCVLA